MKTDCVNGPPPKRAVLFFEIRSFARDVRKNKIAALERIAMKSFSGLSLLLVALALFACEVESDQQFHHAQLTSNRSVVYVYRPYRLMGAPLEPEVTCGRNTIAIGAGGYHGFTEEPGTIACYASSDANSKIQFDARPATEYYVREDVTPGLTEGHVTLTQVSRSRGLSEIDGMMMQ